MKTEVDNLTSDQIRTFLKEGSLTLGEFKITDAMLKVNKQFKKEISDEWATASNEVSLMLDSVLTDELKANGLSREITNRIQRLRKNTGISIED